MLVISRRTGENILIGDLVEIAVLDVNDKEKQTTLGIAADKEIRIGDKLLKKDGGQVVALCLSFDDENIFIDDDIEIAILKVDRGQVRLGINAPKDVAIIRKEIAGTPEGKHSDGNIYIRKGI